MADPKELLERYGYGDARWLTPDDLKRPVDPDWNRFALPPREPTAELRNTHRPDDPFMSAAREYVGADATARGAYGMGRTAGQLGADLSRGNYSDATLSLIEILAGMAPIPGAKGKGHEPVRGATQGRPSHGSEAGRLPEPGRVGGGEHELPAPGRSVDPYAPVPGQPRTVKVPGHGEIEARPIPQVEAAAREYAEKMGLPAGRPFELPKLDPERAQRIAAAFDAMEHNPRDPAVRRAYDAMIDETLAQYKMLDNKGFEFLFNQAGKDPYAASPALGYIDMRDNGRLFVFPTLEGYGSGLKLSKEELANNPLLQDAGVKFGGQPASMNDVFRVVHDVYGHNGPGNPFFRAPGEERAWQHHSRMYGPNARPAMTTETRGQNSWLNFGPYAEQNKGASAKDTVYADQKVGLMPDWTWQEGTAKEKP